MKTTERKPYDMKPPLMYFADNLVSWGPQAYELSKRPDLRAVESMENDDDEILQRRASHASSTRIFHTKKHASSSARRCPSSFSFDVVGIAHRAHDREDAEFFTTHSFSASRLSLSPSTTSDVKRRAHPLKSNHASTSSPRSPVARCALRTTNKNVK